MRWIIAVVGILAGLVLGLGYGWTVNPIKFSDATPASLRIDYRTDYVLTVAEAFHTSQDLGHARRQLALLGSASYADLCDRALREAQRAGYSPGDVSLLEELRRAIQTHSPAAAPTGGAP